jgi:large subunit ribosomal protein L23
MAEKAEKAKKKPVEKEEKKPAKNVETKPAAEAKPKAAHKQEKPAEKAAKGRSGRDPWSVLVHPHLAEKSMNMVEFENKLTFIVRREATKREIKEAIENLFGVKVVSVQTEITSKGVKKAYAKLSPEHSAGEIASRLGMV